MSLSIALALDGYWTAAAWSIEGAGIIGIGLRQRNPLQRGLGLLLHFGAALLFVFHANDQSTTPFVLNSAYLGSVMIAVGACSVLICSHVIANKPIRTNSFWNPFYSRGGFYGGSLPGLMRCSSMSSEPIYYQPRLDSSH